MTLLVEEQRPEAKFNVIYKLEEQDWQRLNIRIYSRDQLQSLPERHRNVGQVLQKHCGAAGQGAGASAMSSVTS